MIKLGARVGRATEEDLTFLQITSGRVTPSALYRVIRLMVASLVMDCKISEIEKSLPLLTLGVTVPDLNNAIGVLRLFLL